MSERLRNRFIVVDLGEQLGDRRRFAVWDVEVSRFWKINSHQTWSSVAELVADFKERDQPQRFEDIYRAQRDTLAAQATILGFDACETP